MEYWSVGVLEYWSIGVLEYWSIGVLEYWSIGILGYSGIGVLCCMLCDSQRTAGPRSQAHATLQHNRGGVCPIPRSQVSKDTTVEFQV